MRLGASARLSRDVASRPAGQATVATHGLGKVIKDMFNSPKDYFQDIPAYLIGEIIDEMIEGKPEPTEEEIQEWLTWELEREAETLLAEYR